MDGIGFDPSDEEIIVGYLRPKVEGEAIAYPRFIVDLDEELYKLEPWMLPNPQIPDFSMYDRRFYLGKRTGTSGSVRVVGEFFDGAWRYREGHHKEIRSKETGEVIGYGVDYRFHFRDKKEEGMMVATDWFLREYRLQSFAKRKKTIHVFCSIEYRLKKDSVSGSKSSS